MKSKLDQRPDGISLHLSNKGIVAAFLMAAGGAGLLGAGSYTAGRVVEYAEAAPEIRARNEAIRDLTAENQLKDVKLEGIDTTMSVVGALAISQQRRIEALETVIEMHNEKNQPPRKLPPLRPGTPPTLL